MLSLTDATDSTDIIGRKVIDIYKVFTVPNVKSYTYVKFNSWAVDVFSPLVINDAKQYMINHYMVIDTMYHDAFSHWTFESAIYLPLFNILKQQHPTLKLVLQAKKSFKLLFCKYFGITEEDIVYQFDVTTPSITFFPSPISSLNIRELHPEHMKQVDSFWDYFKPDEGMTNQYNLTVMPRQTNENYKGNDRFVPLLETIQFAQTIPNSTILHTDYVVDLRDQMKIVQRSKVVVLTDGSPFIVNGMFCYDKHIIVTGSHPCVQGQSTIYQKMAYLSQKIKNQNRSVHFLHEESEACKKVVELLAYGSTD